MYTRGKEQHIEHLRIMLELLRDNKLVAKSSKCSFDGSKVEYLSHVVTGDGVTTKPGKIKAVLEWPKHTSVKQL